MLIDAQLRACWSENMTLLIPLTIYFSLHQVALASELGVKGFQASYYKASCEPGPIQSVPSRLFRDSAGRIRIDDYCSEIGPEPYCLLRRIYDPINNLMVVLNDPNRTALVIRHSVGASVSVIGFFPIDAVGTMEIDVLGSKEVEGLLCRGYRIGATEYWVSDELGLPILAMEDNEVRMRISDIELIEPDRVVFTIPDDYQIQEERFIE
jgi:hypothetical protein